MPGRPAGSTPSPGTAEVAQSTVGLALVPARLSGHTGAGVEPLAGGHGEVLGPSIYGAAALGGP
jgi:hypothetical protein